MSSLKKLNSSHMEVGGLRIRVAVHQGMNSGGLPLLLFNGIGAGTELLQPFIDEMQQTTIICYDAPGAGESEAPACPWRFSKHAALAANILGRLGVDRVNVLGVSWGGALAQQFARQYPQHCNRLVLAATSPGQLMVPGHPAVMIRMSNPRRYLDPKYMQRIAPQIYGGVLRGNKSLAREYGRAMTPPSTKGYYFQMLSILGWSSLPWLHKLIQPTLVMAGRDDPIVPLVNARIMISRIPDSRLRIVDCGHLFLLTQASELATEIEDFLIGEPTGGGCHRNAVAQ